MPLVVREECPAEQALSPRRGQSESTVVLLLTIAAMVICAYDLFLLTLLM